MRSLIFIVLLLLSRSLVAQDIWSGDVAPDGPKATIIMSKECTTCEITAMVVRPYFERSGWKFEREMHQTSKPGRTYPYWRICVQGRCQEFECDMLRLDERIRSILTKWNVKHR